MTEPLQGLLLVDKPAGLTSHDVVLAVRRKIGGLVKVGHTGTLDPMARGLLILLIGPATKCAALYQKLSKVYRGKIRLGLETDSGDLDGKAVRESQIPALSAESIQEAMNGFLGPQEMAPPIYSAIKYNGKPLYTYARKGIEVALKNRPCHIFEWQFLSWASPEISFRLHCSHGTYARSLAVELGRKLGAAAVLSELVREKIGDYHVAQALAYDSLSGLSCSELTALLLPVDIAMAVPAQEEHFLAAAAGLPNKRQV